MKKHYVSMPIIGKTSEGSHTNFIMNQKLVQTGSQTSLLESIKKVATIASIVQSAMAGKN